MPPTGAQMRDADLASQMATDFEMGPSYAGPGASGFLDIPAVEMTPENREAAMAANEMLLEWVEAQNAAAAADALAANGGGNGVLAGVPAGGLSEAARLEEENRMLDEYFGLQ